MLSDYEYAGLMAATWDLFRGDTSKWEDRAFYLEAVHRYGQPVLDVGCGTGRILVDFLAQGIDIDGIDNSPEMLDLARQKAAEQGLHPNLYLGVMEAMKLPRRYQTILVPSSSFQLLVEPGQPEQAMQCFYQHLLPGGYLVMPFMQIWKEGDPLEQEWEREAVRASDGAVAKRWSYTRYDPVTRLEHTEDRYQITLNGQVIAEEHHRRSPATRSYNQDQAEALYRQAGLVDIQVFSQFTFNPAEPGDWLVTIVGRRLE